MQLSRIRRSHVSGNTRIAGSDLSFISLCLGQGIWAVESGTPLDFSVARRVRTSCMCDITARYIQRNRINCATVRGVNNMCQLSSQWWCFGSVPDFAMNWQFLYCVAAGSERRVGISSELVVNSGLGGKLHTLPVVAAKELTEGCGC